MEWTIMKMLLLATLAVALSGLTGCQSCGDQNPCDDDRMLGMGMFHKKHFGFGKKDCDACSTGGPILDGGIGQASGCGCESQGHSAMMPVSMSNNACGCGNGSLPQQMPAGMSGGGEMSGLPAGTIVTESLPTPAQQPLGGMYRGASPNMATPGPE
jgi:hypothetical protein